MKKIYLCLFAAVLLENGCKREPSSICQIQNLEHIPLISGQFEEHSLDSAKILYPQGIHYFNRHLILVEPKNDPVLSFWNAEDFTYEFSAARKGGGPEEVKYVDCDYFYKTDTSFFILDSDIEKEITLNDTSISVRKRMPILIPDAVNRLIHIDSSSYVMCGLNGGNKEHILYTIDGTYTEFGDYPECLCPPEKRFIFCYKFIAHNPGETVIYNFYQYLNLIRKYDLSGQLLAEISLTGIPERNNTMDKLRNSQIMPYFHNASSHKKYMSVLFYENATNAQVYHWEAKPELQLWSWNGKLIRRYQFDKCFDQYTISDKGILYALDSGSPYKIYTYDLQWETVL